VTAPTHRRLREWLPPTRRIYVRTDEIGCGVGALRGPGVTGPAEKRTECTSTGPPHDSQTTRQRRIMRPRR